ncbi:hypothetical protein MXM19_08400 [Aeromonas caviae]|uniref:hypothetical protein n=1 Tax=Aeromonas caviae TaxID=648 RepID=UPI002DB7277E|nr:hypothetical protein [Aeromonas caviae]MEB6640866.1 hypothetical protein [Aeromonas caviae]
MSIESELLGVLKQYKSGSITVYPFEVPDSDKANEAIAFEHLSSRVDTRYYNKEKEIRNTLFHVVRVCSGYLDLCDDSAFESLLNKYNGGSILNIKIEDTSDHKLQNGFERLYTIEVTHVVNFQ